jgi:hypothetical protein
MEYTLKQVRKTITTIFMVPTLGIPKSELSNNGFINGFVKDEMRDVQYGDAIYLLFRPEQIDKFREFLDSEYERTKHVIDDYDYPNGFVVVVYKLNMTYRKDYELVKRGKYSKTSMDFQKEFPKVVKIVDDRGLHHDEISIQYRVFKRTGDLLKYWENKFDVTFDDEQEIWHGFDEQNETLTEDKLNEYL